MKVIYSILAVFLMGGLCKAQPVFLPHSPVGTGCFFMPWQQPGGSSFNSILLVNDNRDGWFTVFSKVKYPLLLVNLKNKDAKFVLAPYKGISFNWLGTQQVGCFAYKTYGIVYTLDALRNNEIYPVNCTDVLNLVRCQQNGAAGGQDLRYDLQLNR